MPLPPLPDPSNKVVRWLGAARGIPTTMMLTGTLLAANAAQVGSVAALPVSRALFRRINRWIADEWWGLCVTSAEALNGARIVVSGDDVPAHENALLIANHQQMPDITFLMQYAKTKGRLGDLKWFVKKPIKYVPGIGWGMYFLDCFFVERKWSSDRAAIARTFERILQDRIPIWVISFSEGTRVTPAKVRQSQEYARKEGLEPLDHVLLPRSKGFIATIHGLRSYLDAVYDITIGYEDGVPTLWQYVEGFATVAHLHVRRFPVAQLPDSDADLNTWLHERFREKDKLLGHFYEHGSFPQTV